MEEEVGAKTEEPFIKLGGKAEGAGIKVKRRELYGDDIFI